MTNLIKQNRFRYILLSVGLAAVFAVLMVQSNAPRASISTRSGTYGTITGGGLTIYICTGNARDCIVQQDQDQ